MEENFVNYQRDGLRRTWHGDGQLEYEGYYKDDKPNGLHKSWYEDGQLMNEHIYKGGNCVNAKCWDEDGNEIECD